MQVIKEEGSRPIKAWVGVKENPSEFGRVILGKPTLPDIEDAALTQLKNLARLPFIASNGVAVMPDVHAGIGSTVGSVIATNKAIIPAAVGVDIGCGMNAVRLSLKASQLPDSLTAIRHQIERDVPLGAGGAHKTEEINAGERRYQIPKLSPNRIDIFHKIGDIDKLVTKARSQVGRK